jgi:hypothetical protein
VGADGVEERGRDRDWMDEGEEQADRKKTISMYGMKLRRR